MSRIKTHVKKGDQVVVISGAAKGAQGTVIEVQPAKNRVLIEGVRMIKKTIRPSQDKPQGRPRSYFECETRRNEGREGPGRQEKEES
jgi:ribosomal protein L24